MLPLIHLLPLPGLWLLAWAIGAVGAVLPRARPLLVLAFSSLALLVFTSWQAWTLYTATGVAVVALAIVIARRHTSQSRRGLLAAGVCGLLALLLCYLLAPHFFVVFFPNLPSLSYEVFRGIALLAAAARGATFPASAALLQLLFLPTVVLGPVTRVEHFVTAVRPALHESARRLCLGLLMLIAGHLAGLQVPRPFAFVHDTPPAGVVWLGVLANSFELYFLFAGYSHLVIGLGALLGFRLPENFMNPYLSPTIGEFWRRWHMSLSFFIRDHVYIPLGGNRRGLIRKNVNMIVSMALCGLWHGITTGFLVWGVYHGVLLAVDGTMRQLDISPLRRLPPPIRHGVGVGTTFLLVTIGWIPFTWGLPTAMRIVGIMFRGL